MIKTNDKKTLYVILSVLDILLLTILYRQYKQLSKFDIVYILCILVSHIILFLSLWSQWCTIIDILHYFLFLSIVLAIFIRNGYLQLIVLSLVVLIQVLWVYKGRCIMNTMENENENFWGFTNELTVATLMFTVVLSFKYGRSF